MRTFLDGGGRLDVVGQSFASQVVFIYAAITPTGTVVPDTFATADAFLQDRFGIDVGILGNAAVDPAADQGVAIQGVAGDPIGDGVTGTLAPSFGGLRDTVAVVGTGQPTFLSDPARSVGSNVVGTRTAFEPTLGPPGTFAWARPGRTTLETFSTADLPGPAGLLARSRILDYL
jgi:hypothetical protein